jgi:hypothetical protein
MIRTKLTIVAEVPKRAERDDFQDHFNDENKQSNVIQLLSDLIKVCGLRARLQQHHEAICKNYTTDEQFEFGVVN